MIKKWMAAGAVVLAICGMACATSTFDRCSSDQDCKGTRVCSDGVCVDPTQQQTDSGTNNNTDGNVNNPTCDPVGTPCTATANCCQSGTGIGTAGAICISNDNLCHAACSSNAECQSGCCALVEGQSLGVCAAATQCAPPPTCGQAGAACVTPTDCCQTGTPYGETCLSEDYICHDVCYASTDCTSGCCIQLQGQSYGACGAAAGHVCL